MVADSNLTTTAETLPRRARFRLLRMLGRHWKDSVRHYGWRKTIRQSFAALGRALRESLPDHRRARFGDLDFDFDHNVDTTRSNAKFVPQFIAMLIGSPYFASEPWLFQEMMQALPIEFQAFTFVDLGSGKARALLLAAQYPFQQIIGVEFMPDLNSIARRNVAAYPQVESLEMDARDFEFPSTPLVVYMFNPFPEPVFAAVLANLECSWRESPRAMYIAYRSPELEHSLAGCKWLENVTGNERWVVYRAN